MMEIYLSCKHLPKNVRWRRWLPLLTLFLLLPSYWSCDDSEEGRNEFISVSHVDNQTGEKVEMKPDEALNIPPKAGQLSLLRLIRIIQFWYKAKFLPTNRRKKKYLKIG